MSQHVCSCRLRNLLYMYVCMSDALQIHQGPWRGQPRDLASGYYTRQSRRWSASAHVRQNDKYRPNSLLFLCPWSWVLSSLQIWWVGRIQFLYHTNWYKNWNNNCHNKRNSKFRRRHVFYNRLYPYLFCVYYIRIKKVEPKETNVTQRMSRWFYYILRCFRQNQPDWPLKIR